MNLTQKQERFAQDVARGIAAAEAYRKHYNVARMSKQAVWVEASRLATHPKVSLRIRELRAPALVKAQHTIDVNLERLIFENARLAFSDIRKVFNETGGLKAVQQLDPDTAAAIASIKVRALFDKSKDGKGQVGTVTEVKLWNKAEALDALMKHLGGYEGDKDQKPDPLANLPLTVLQAMERRLSELVESRAVGRAAGRGSDTPPRARAQQAHEEPSDRFP